MLLLISRKHAKAWGIKRYFTGKPCRHGHLTERMVSTCGCIECLRTNSKSDYEKKGDEKRAKSRARMLKLRLADPGKFNERSRLNYAAHTKAWKERVRRYRIENADKVRVWDHLKKRRLRDAEGHFTFEDLVACYEAQNGLCVCGADLLDGWTVDHKMPTSRGGTNWPENIQLLCLSCNCSKHTKTMEEWLHA